MRSFFAMIRMIVLRDAEKSKKSPVVEMVFRASFAGNRRRRDLTPNTHVASKARLSAIRAEDG